MLAKLSCCRIVQHSNMTKDMLEEQIVQATPLRRWVKPSEIGGLAGLLVSDAAALITGQFLMAGKPFSDSNSVLRCC